MAELNVDFFGENVFNDKAMQEFLDAETYKQLKSDIIGGEKLEKGLADKIAEAMKNWAISKGATHYTHWFQPMTSITAGKHDAFLDKNKQGRPVLAFTGKELQKGEPDASSFPSGGLRATFEARGYTMWDATSPAFVRDRTLYIPTAFCSYTGQALDLKTPLLKSMQALNKQTLKVLRLLGNTTSQCVIPSVGAEQEYFLIDRDLYEQRLDLKICGRTLFGAKPPKGQELDDHYCGRIRIRVSKFMHQLDDELWRLGVLSKTKHNEAAPAQHELAPLYAKCNIACDNNQLIMETMRVTAKKLGLACLLHERPFEGVNGSGKHNNWSLSTNDGINLLAPGKKPAENKTFLLFLSAVIAGVDEYADLIRLSAASAGNDYRLGGNEAPPAIISIFLGDELTRILRSIAHGNEIEEKDGQRLKTGVKVLPEFDRDDCDRNRTSPFAFTGNKFEFRMVGSSASIASANYMLNTAVAEMLGAFAQRLEQAADINTEIDAIVADTYKRHGRVIFNGNNYSRQWHEEAAKRGLLNIDNTVDAIKACIEPKNIALFEKHKIFTEEECYARYEILQQTYEKTVSIEAATMLEMARRQIIPACIQFAGSVAKSVNAMQAAGCVSAGSQRLLSQLVSKTDRICEDTDRLEQALQKAQSIQDVTECSVCYRDSVRKAMAQLRASCDEIEVLVDKQAWPFPTYTDLLHRVK